MSFTASLVGSTAELPGGVVWQMLAVSVCVLAFSVWMLQRRPVTKKSDGVTRLTITETRRSRASTSSSSSSSRSSRLTRPTPATPRPGARGSTFGWLYHKLTQTTHRDIAENKIELQHASTCHLLQEENAPVNILVCEGGGLRGQALMGMIRGLTEKNHGDDILQYFDLACGTSVGGITAFVMNREGTTQGTLQEGGDILIGTCERSFKNLSWWSLFRTGSLTNQENDLGTVFREKYGNTPLYNPDGLKAFALTTLKSVDDINGETKREPFLLRTYDLPDEEVGDNTADSCQLQGTNEVKLWEAMTMTSAALGLSDRVEVQINGETKTFADGEVIANNPTAIAILEARRLWPNRPIGVVVSLSLMNNERPVVLKGAEKAKKLHPTMKFAYFWPPIKIHMALDTSPKKLQEAVDLAYDYIMESEEARGVVENLKASGTRWASNRKQSYIASSSIPRFTTWFRASQMVQRLRGSSIPEDTPLGST